jgi:hypothetical protein
MLDQWNVRREPRDPLVDVFKRLKIRDVNQGKECLFKGLGDGRDLVEESLKIFVKELRRCQRAVNRAADSHRNGTEPAAGCRIGKQVVSQNGVQVENGIAVVQNHLSLTGILTLGLLAKGDEPLGFKK